MALSKTQNLILELLKKSPLRNQFYWTGGTLLSEVYLHHRQSFDIDLFNEKHFTPKKLVKLVEKKFKVTISESTLFSEIMKRAENITSLQTLIFDTPKKQKTTLLTIQKYFKNASADFLAHHWKY